jgi:hypothetical protein
VLFAGTGSAVRYATLSSLDRYSYDVQGLAERKFSNRWSAFLRSSAQTSISSEATVNGEAVLLPLVTSHMQTAATGSAYRLSQLTTITVEGRFAHATFDSPGLSPASSFGGRAALAHRYNPRSDYGLTYVVDEYSETAPTSYVQTMTADWAPRSARVAARFSGGVSNVGNSIGDVGQITGIGNAYVETTVAHGVTYLRIGRFAGQAFGLGQILVTNQIGAGYARNAFRGTEARLSADRAWSEDARVPGERTVTTNIAARLAKQFGIGLTIGAETFLQHRNEGGSISNRGIRVVAGYAIGSGRGR